tara:strand:+ start:973 stop:1719 length:747 start_codon:yes stop_codon:yes gene_type:complete
MATLLLKKSYLHKDLKEIKFNDLWNNYGVFTTMRVVGKKKKILFFKDHIENLIKSIKIYKLNRKNLKKNISNIIKANLKIKMNYDHLLRVAVNKKMISISLRKRTKSKFNFKLKLLNYKRIDPVHKNLKYKKILSFLKKLDNREYDVALYKNNKFLETGTSNLLFIKKNKIYSPKRNFYTGITFKFFKKRIKITFKVIYIKDIKNYDEIILIGSGKAVTSVSSIEELKWKRKSLKIFNKLKLIYQKVI